MATYCPACGINVETTLVSEPARQVWMCANCNLPLKQELTGTKPVLGKVPLARMSPEELAREQAAQRAAAEARRLAAVREAAPRAKGPASAIPERAIADVELDGSPDDPLELETTSRSGSPPRTAPARFETILIADDSALLRAVLADQFREKRISDRIELCANGEELLERATELLSTGGGIDLAIFDVEMPVLNGYHAAIALRAIEKGLHAPVPTPVIFFTARVCDETFRKVLEYTQPARYLNKGEDGARIPERLASVLASLR